MQYHWVGRNVDLKALSERVELYFTERELEPELKKITGEYKIEVAGDKILSAQIIIEVKILGQPNNFTVEIAADKRRGFLSPLMTLGYIAQNFWGGIILKEIKARETWEKFEEKFWEYVNEQVIHLSDSNPLIRQ